ncbi:lysosomal dipeptide transporter MFSD1 isoform X1 [Equus caballus]|uniref:lysosomal dipeptide transporter MFSD1 isoform X1 n=1 Tax=Equus caballus TaxID=9796 RepID=UPI0038B2CAE7
MCFLGFGSYFCYDNPAALQSQFKRDMQVNTTKFMLLYAWYSWPNVVLCFFGGFLIDRVFGIRWGTIIFSCFVCTGQVVFALGGIFNAFWLMEFGRFVFGIGGESLAVAQNTYAVSWFKGKELNLVFGLQLSMARIALRAVRGDWKLAVMGGPPSPANFVELSLTQR